MVKNQKFILSFSGIAKFWFLLFFAITVNNVAASRDRSKYMILIHDRECATDTTFTKALVQKNKIPRWKAAVFELKLRAAVRWTRALRMKASLAVDEEIQPARRLSEMDWHDRRDEMISALGLMIEEKIVKSGRSFNNTSSTVSHNFYENVGIDVVYGDLLPEGETFDVATDFPCLAVPPQPNLPSFALNTPNDYSPTLQWYLDSAPVGIGATKAWECQTGQKNGPVIAVIDSGCTPHPDLKKNLCTCKDDCFGMDAVDGVNPHNEEKAHGTTVSGLIAAVSNNGLGVSGVCWGCKIMCIKAADKNGVFHSDTIVAAINHVIKNKHLVKITNHSYGGYGRSLTETYAYMELRKAGILAIAAAGNENCNMEKPNTNECVHPWTKRPMGRQRPAGLFLDNIISVGAVDKYHQKAKFSNYGKSMVDFFAPGVNIRGLCNTKLQNCMYSEHSGTSFAAPITAGAAALLWAQDLSMTFSDVKEIMMRTVRKVDGLKELCVTGGILDIGAAMKEVAKRKACSPVSKEKIPTPNKDFTIESYKEGYCDTIENITDAGNNPIPANAELTKQTMAADWSVERKTDKKTKKGNSKNGNSKNGNSKNGNSSITSIFIPLVSLLIYFLSLE